MIIVSMASLQHSGVEYEQHKAKLWLLRKKDISMEYVGINIGFISRLLSSVEGLCVNVFMEC